MKRLGLFNIDRMTYGEPVQNPEGGYARLKEESMEKIPLQVIGRWRE